MLTVDNVHTARRERLIRGRDHWWFLGPSGIAKVYEHQVDADGHLLPRAEQYLRDAGLYDIRPPTRYALTVLTSTDCNLGCGYCFQNTGQDPNGGNRPPRMKHARLTSEMIGRTLEFAGRQMAAAGLQQLSIMLFGGEPLLNFRGCCELLTRAADYGLTRAAMVSNGVLLTPLIARELHDRGLATVQVTFDGEAEAHDNIRVRRSGGGSFDAIVNNVVRASQATSLTWSLRVNVSHHNRAGIGTLINQLAGRLDPRRCMLYFTWVDDVGVGYANELSRTEGLAEEYAGWNRQAVELGFTPYCPGAQKACSTCSFRDGKYGAVVHPDGILSSCWASSGIPGWDVGDIDTGYRSAAETEGRWETCEGMAQREGASELASFHDLADAAVLDDLAAVGRL